MPLPERRWPPQRPSARLEEDLGFFIPKLSFGAGGGAWVNSDSEKPAPVTGRVREGPELSIPARGMVIGGGDQGVGVVAVAAGDRAARAWEKEMRQFYLAAAGVSIFREI